MVILTKDLNVGLPMGLKMIVDEYYMLSIALWVSLLKMGMAKVHGAQITNEKKKLFG